MTNSLFSRALEEVANEAPQEQPQAIQQDPAQDPQQQPQQEDQGMLQSMVGGVAEALRPASELWRSVGAGVAKAGFETKDFIFGEPAQEDKSQIRKDIEQRSTELRASSPVNGVAESISQFAMGMVGASKLTAPLKGAQMSKAALTGWSIAEGAIAGAIVIDPHEERLSNIVQQFPVLENPVTEFLMAKPDDSAAMGRLKNSLEGIGMDLAITAVLGASLKVIRAARGGDDVGVQQALKEIEDAQVNDEISTGDPLAGNLEGVPVGPEVGSVDTTTSPASGVGTVEPSSVDGGAGQAVAQMPEGVTVQQVKSAGKTPKDASKFTAPTEIVPEENITDALKGAKSDMEAIRQFGSYQEAAANGYKFSTGKFPQFRDINGPEEMQFFMDRLKTAREAELLGNLEQSKELGGVAKAKLPPQQSYLKVMGDAEVRTMLEGRAKMFNEDPHMVMGQIQKAGQGAAKMVSDLEVSYVVSNKLLQDAYQTAIKVHNGILGDWGGDAAMASQELTERFALALNMVDNARNQTANIGRALRRHRKDFAKDTQDVMKGLQSLKPEQLAEVLAKSGGDPEKLAKLTNPTWMQRVIGEINFSMTNSLLWLWPTHLVNTTSNLYMLAARPTEKLIGAGLQGNSELFKQSLKEYRYTVAAVGDAWTNAVEAFKRGDSVIQPHGDEFFAGADMVTHAKLPWKPVQNLGDLLSNLWTAANYRNIVGLPTRALGAVDEMVKNLRYRAVVQAEASIQGQAAGLKGDDLKSYIKDYLEKSFDEAGTAIDAKALREAQTTAFQQPLDYPTVIGSAGKTLQNARTNMPLLGIVMPFIKTPVNVLRYGVKYTPLLNYAQTEYRHMIGGKMGVEAQAQAVGQMTLGSLFAFQAGLMAAEGRLTGGGPSDPKLKQELMDKGWKPYSIVWENEAGEKQYLPMGRFDPVGLPLGIIADIVDMRMVHPDAKETDSLVGAVVLGLANNLKERSYLSGLTQALDAINEPDKKFSKWAGGVAAAAMPGSSLLRGVNPDPYMREARGFVDNALKNVPGYSDKLPIRRDAFGEPMIRRIGLVGSESSDLVEAEHQRIILETGSGINPPAPTKNGVDLRDIKLEDGRNAYDRMQELAAAPSQGKSLKESLAKLIQSEKYQKLVDGPADEKGTKTFAIAGVVRRYREAGFARLLKESPKLRQELSKRAVEVRSKLVAKREGAKSQRDAVVEGLAALGIQQ